MERRLANRACGSWRSRNAMCVIDRTGMGCVRDAFGRLGLGESPILLQTAVLIEESWTKYNSNILIHLPKLPRRASPFRTIDRGLPSLVRSSRALSRPATRPILLFLAVRKQPLATMLPKRKAKSQFSSNAASAVAYTDQAGSAPNKRSKTSKPVAKAFTKSENASNDDSAIVTQGRGGIEHHDEEASFDHSRPEEKAGIVDRRYYPAEMSNERCAMYNADEIPRPMEILNQTLEETKKAREKIGKRAGGEAVIHWFKRDLRIRDNTGLSKAAELAKAMGVGVIGVWIMSPQDWQAHLVSPAKCDFELRSVELLQKELAELDVPLYVETVSSRKTIPARLVELAGEWGAKNLFCNLEFEPDELRREENLVRLGAEKGVNVECCQDDCVVPPGSLKTGGGRQYAVYSPWYRAWVAHLHAHPHLLNERPMPEKNPAAFKKKFDKLYHCEVPEAPESKKLTKEEKERFAHVWPAGESAAIDRLQHFLTEKIGRYQATRNFPSANSTACVSVHHAAGTLAARTSVRMARDVNSTKKLDGGIEGIKGWISEVAWRDFYRHVLVHWPYVW